MSNKIFNTFSAKETQQLAGVILADLIKRLPKNKPLILALQGDLGSGKTTFTQGIAKALGIKKRITSPTFVLIHKFKIQKAKVKFLFHIDAYRLQRPEEILNLGWQEIVSNPKNIVVIEWPERIKAVLSKNCPTIKFDFIDKTKRKITFLVFRRKLC